MKMQLLVNFDEGWVGRLKSQLDSEIELTYGKENEAVFDSEVIISGLPKEEILEKNKKIHTLVIPWAGLPKQTRELMLKYPDIKIYNIHHNAVPTAENAFSLMLAVAKDIIPIDQNFRKFDWRPRYSDSKAVTLSGKTALIFVGDGQYKGHDPVSAIKQMKDRYGDNVCLYTVLVGSEEPSSVETMQAMAEAGECGYYQSAKYLDTPQNLSTWVANVFLSEVEKPAVVAAPPKPGDSDGDGVTDDIDQCPNTPSGAPVNEEGCWIIDNVYFDFDKADIKSEYYAVLVEIADVMKINPDISVLIEGNTDSIGAEKYNEKLGERRAMAAKQYLVNQGVSEDRISTVSLGFSMPADTNDTEAGRAKNRRSEFKWSR